MHMKYAEKKLKSGQKLFIWEHYCYLIQKEKQFGLFMFGVEEQMN